MLHDVLAGKMHLRFGGFGACLVGWVYSVFASESLLVNCMGQLHSLQKSAAAEVRI